MDAETIETMRRVIMWSVLVGLAALLVTLFVAAFLPELRRAWRRARRASRVAAVLFAAGLTLYAGAKHAGRFTFDSYLTDAGSYLTNDVAHVAARKTSPVIPDSTPVRVFARELAQTNAENWTELAPHRTYADLPDDWALPNATNHNVYVALDWHPAQPTETNYLFQTTPVAVLGGQDATNGVRAVIPRSKLMEEPK